MRLHETIHVFNIWNIVCIQCYLLTFIYILILFGFLRFHTLLSCTCSKWWNQETGLSPTKACILITGPLKMLQEMRLVEKFVRLENDKNRIENCE